MPTYDGELSLEKTRDPQTKAERFYLAVVDGAEVSCAVERLKEDIPLYNEFRELVESERSKVALTIYSSHSAAEEVLILTDKRFRDDFYGIIAPQFPI